MYCDLTTKMRQVDVGHEEAQIGQGGKIRQGCGPGRKNAPNSRPLQACSFVAWYLPFRVYWTTNGGISTLVRQWNSRILIAEIIGLSPREQGTANGPQPMKKLSPINLISAPSRA